MIAFIKKLFTKKKTQPIDRAHIKRNLKQYSKNQLITMVATFGAENVAYRRKHKQRNYRSLIEVIQEFEKVNASTKILHLKGWIIKKMGGSK